jgi:hypothetical protein
MAEEVALDQQREYVETMLAKFMEFEELEEKKRRTENNRPPRKKPKKKSAEPTNDGIFLKALLQNAPTEAGKTFILEDIYTCLKNNNNDYGCLSELAAYWEIMLVLPSKSQCPNPNHANLVVTAKLNVQNTTPHPSRRYSIENEYLHEIEAASRSPQASLKKQVIAASLSIDSPRL